MDNRRDFIKKSAFTTAGIGIIPGLAWSKTKIAPSDQINVGLIGCRSKGFQILDYHLQNEGVNCLGMCDVDQNILDERASEIRSKYDQKPKLYGDFRKMLEDKDIDVVIVGTPGSLALPSYRLCLRSRKRCVCGKTPCQYHRRMQHYGKSCQKVQQGGSGRSATTKRSRLAGCYGFHKIG